MLRHAGYQLRRDKRHTEPMILLVAFMSRQNCSGGGYVSILARQATRCTLAELRISMPVRGMRDAQNIACTETGACAVFFTR